MSDEKSDMKIEAPEDSLPEVSFEELPEGLRQACERAGWTKLMPVQAHSLPYLLQGRDLMVQSRTGSGKTGAFVLPMLEKVDPAKDACQALVMLPTRELARQVAREAEMLSGPDGPRVAAVYGGVGYGEQTEALRGGAQIVVGTPGRVLDHLLHRNFTLDEIRMLVFDEADRMLSIGFYPDMKAVQRYLPKMRINALMFSATYPPQVIRLANEFMTDQEMLSLSSSSVHVAEVNHVYYNAPRMEKDRILVRIIETENPASAFIFCNTKAQVHYLTAVLQNFGYNADELSADLTQAKREKILERVRKRQVRFLVATDVAARGIDVPELSHVVLYEPPEDQESYIHRAGRTGRAGAAGEVISLTDTMEEVNLQRIARNYKINLEKREAPTEEDVQKVVAERTTALLEAELRKTKALQQERIQRFLPLARELAGEDDSLALLAFLLDDFHHKNLHTPPPAPEADKPEGKPKEGGKPSGGGPKDGRNQGGKSEGGGQDGGPKKKRKRRPRKKNTQGGQGGGE
ncbi:DEAD/DEAH box helicase [Desulfohalovibrio reitneri]|uniref:DEAD/DEAH box helicase n=1 Tax=Desulfohalovibrio reitneri TaxID=1307759 RepID=UPI0009DEC657|nr:DEAD/DEAH box helicase [Desulfohalovibrio reitneri]